MRLDAYMQQANAAYYAGHDPFADFTTSPEISQAFGELLGLWAATVWMEMGSPADVILAECGPGRGTLMRDAMRAIEKMVPAFRQALQLHLVENSPRLRATQSDLPVTAWHDRVEDLPPGPMILIGNEFFDALPIRQFIRGENGWTERAVEDGRATEIPADSPLYLPEAAPQPGDRWEMNEAAVGIVRHLAKRFATQSGAALFIDYGPAASGYGDSLQALRGGEPCDPFDAPGSADLTAHVDFSVLCRAAREEGAETWGPIRQGVLLHRLGLFPRLHRLAQNCPPIDAMKVMQAGTRLTEPDHMGELFKAIVICHPNFCPPGFAA